MAILFGVLLIFLGCILIIASLAYFIDKLDDHTKPKYFWLKVLGFLIGSICVVTLGISLPVGESSAKKADTIRRAEAVCNGHTIISIKKNSTQETEKILVRGKTENLADDVWQFFCEGDDTPHYVRYGK
jgi:hypothetical protein